MSERVKNNMAVGRAYYQALTDAAGHPSGIPYWAELSAKDQYWHAATGLLFLESLQRDGLISFVKDLGLEGGWDEDDCKALMDGFEAALPAEKAEWEERIAMVNKAYKKGKKPPA